MRARLQRILAGAGLGSRRAAEALLRAGRVTVNGAPAQLGDSADPAHDRIEVDGERIHLAAPAYWILHKPRGVVTTRRDPEGRPTVMDAVPRELREQLFPVGRLDRDSEGLVLLTNDGALADRLMHPSWGCEKEYRVRVAGRVGDDAVARLERGVRLAEARTAPARVLARRYDPEQDCTHLRLVLREGRNRQIRRMLARQGLRATRLVRVRMGPLHLEGLARSRARPLAAGELRELLRHAEGLSRAGRPRAATRRQAARRRRP